MFEYDVKKRACLEVHDCKHPTTIDKTITSCKFNLFIMSFVKEIIVKILSLKTKTDVNVVTRKVKLIHQIIYDSQTPEWRHSIRLWFN